MFHGIANMLCYINNAYITEIVVADKDQLIQYRFSSVTLKNDQ